MDSPLSSSLAGRADSRRPHRARLLRPTLILLVGSTLVAGAARGWEEVRHEHEGGHGPPARPAALEKAVVGPFVARDGSSVTVLDASCGGDGEVVDGGYTHFSCRLLFADGEAEEVVVHLLGGDELFFKSPL